MFNWHTSLFSNLGRLAVLYNWFAIFVKALVCPDRIVFTFVDAGAGMARVWDLAPGTVMRCTSILGEASAGVVFPKLALFTSTFVSVCRQGNKCRHDCQLSKRLHCFS